VAVLFLDLDRFKSVNDGLGHAAGDEVLVNAAERLQSCLRRTDTAARVGGDEFAVVLEDFDTEQEAVSVAARVVEALKEPFSLNGREIATGASVGLCLVGSADELMRAADAAMYEAKRKGKSRYAVSGPSGRRARVLVPGSSSLR
jgi:diguanylate cyclase (GGDEF)-like protein